MTGKAVADASAVIAFLFKEKGWEEVGARLSEKVLHAPDLLPYEVASACLKKIRSKPEETEELLNGLSMLADFPVALEKSDPLTALLLASENNLSIYDASYLDLAQKLGCELITLDKRLLKVSKDAR